MTPTLATPSRPDTMAGAQRLARMTGLLFLVTYAASIPPG